MPTQPALSALAALVVSFACLWILLSPLGRRLMLDRPNERSLHAQPVPRSGGLAIAAGVAALVAVYPGALPRELVTILFGAGWLLVLSLIDDVFNLPTLLRLAGHLAAAAFVLTFAVGLSEGWLFAVMLVSIAWCANLYNFMDGSDGLAGGMAVFGFGTYAWAAHQAGDPAFAVFCLGIAAAALAFLAMNFHPARLFMGDAGSVPLGFLAGALGVTGWRVGLWPLWFPLLVFAPFVCDATLTLLRRLLRGERVWLAHKEHYYQRLVRMGFGHRGTAWVEYGAMLACAMVALLAREAGPGLQAAALCGSAAALIAAAAWIDLRWRRFRGREGAAQ